MYRSYITHANDIGFQHLEELLHDQLLYMVQGMMEVSMLKVFLVSWYSGSASVHVCSMFSLSSKLRMAHVATISSSIAACRAVSSH